MGRCYLVAKEDVLIKPGQKRLPPAWGYEQQDAVGLHQALRQVNSTAFPVHKNLPQEGPMLNCLHPLISSHCCGPFARSPA